MARAVCTFKTDKLEGQVLFTQASEDAATSIRGQLRGMPPGKHAFSINVYGDLSGGFSTLGGHFNPFGKNHGAPSEEERHVGSLGNIEAGPDGIANIHLEDRLVKLIGPLSVIGRSMVVYANDDDFGKGSHELSLKNGNAGNPLTAGVIGIASNIQ